VVRAGREDELSLDREEVFLVTSAEGYGDRARRELAG
jgi:hypothetical protein